ncbi:unnamed protein product [Schistosoma mattheei]|uniref:Uncharacterized protein n=1 Tax=Schistosoma mattheei TaxID=31246 RepID=A0A183PYI7_9TREM|nr:unnamed protein product [Schistosoma mattheei]
MMMIIIMIYNLIYYHQNREMNQWDIVVMRHKENTHNYRLL